MRQARRKREDFGNRVLLSERVLALSIAAIALFVAYDVLISDRVTFVERRRLFRRLWNDKPLTVVILDGWPVFWMFVVLVMVALMALTFVFDHYDRRFNERFYVRLRRGMLIATALVAGVVVCSAYQQIWSR